MSVEWFAVFPTDPQWVPSQDREDAARAVFEVLMGADIEVKVNRPGRVVLEDAGECIETIGCPACGTLVGENPKAMDWWVAQLDRVWTDSGGFWPLDVTMPCCGVQTSLDDLVYDAPQGFASWSVAARNPVYAMGEEMLALVGAALGHPVRWAHRHT
ncbi:hypothetical protein A5792_01855 [Mycolicibacterium peregrinum]|uniref:Uncharacterized protein n=1 Tax=Mycolicibacterium peregrinum TaxID=43304 RepID=A0A1A0RD99_MYCPR|nr:hypothetical protein [Mycolicibacterium peregrinum]OBB32470.1 hypothetical protein A5792_01855 [Mycolicibacterium peregrinum]